MKKDLTGKKFGLLIVIGIDEEKTNESKKRKEKGEIKRHLIYWQCKCECGNITYRSTGKLTSGSAYSCGCGISRYGQIMQDVVNSLGYSSEREYQINNPHPDMSYFRFDLYIPELNLAIEYDGECHFHIIDWGKRGKDVAEQEFKKARHNDEIKKNYCKEHGINLLRIP